MFTLEGLPLERDIHLKSFNTLIILKENSLDMGNKNYYLTRDAVKELDAIIDRMLNTNENYQLLSKSVESVTKTSYSIPRKERLTYFIREEMVYMRERLVHKAKAEFFKKRVDNLYKKH